MNKGKRKKMRNSLQQLDDICLDCCENLEGIKIRCTLCPIKQLKQETSQ